MYPNFKKGMMVGLIAGLVAAVLTFALCVWESTETPATEVSLTWSFRPWWRESNWMFTIAAFFFVGVASGMLAAFRPDMRRKR
jgi:cell division protein FtsX